MPTSSREDFVNGLLGVLFRDHVSCPPPPQSQGVRTRVGSLGTGGFQ